MRIYTRQRVLSGINIVPMLDILTILLIFFIVHTEFKRQVHVLNLELPQTHALAGDNAPPQDILLEIGDDGALALAGRALAPEELVPALRELRRTQPEAGLQISSSQGTAMGELIRILDMLAEAGYTPEDIPLHINYRPEEAR